MGGGRQGLKGQGERYVRRDAKRSSQGPSTRPKASKRFILTLSGALALLIALASTALALQTHAPGSDVEAPADGFGSLAGIATDPSSHQLYVADSGSNRIEGFSASGEFEGTGGWGVIASGPGNVPTNEHQSLTIDATGGTYVLSYEGEPSAAIAFDASAAELQSALEAIAQIGAGNVSVSGPAGGPYDVEFEGSKADTDVSELSADPTNLTGGAQSATVATTAQGADAPEICLIATGNTCKAGVPGNGVGQFNGPQDVTVNASGDFFVADTNNNRIAAFKANGEPLPTFGTEGLIDGTAAQPGSEDETPAPGFSSPCGLAIDDSNGNLFVADQNNNRIWIFDSTGAYKGKIADSSLNGPCGIAFDSTGDLYVRNANNGKVLRFNRQAPTTYDFASTLYDPEAEPKEPGATDVAVDTNTDHVYVDKGDRITEYDSSGSPVSTFGQGQINGSASIAVDSTDAKLYASSGNRIATFGQLITVPDVTTGTASAISDTEATLRGTVDPAGLDTTECHFEYDTAPYAVGGPAHGTEVDCLSGDVIPAAGGAVEVAAPITGLSPATTYHFRLVSANAEGQGRGQDRSFTTVGAPTLPKETPTIYAPTASFVTEVSASAATLNAELNPNGATTSWHFEYVGDAGFQASGFASAIDIPIPDATLAAGTATITVSRALSGLAPGARYHYRIVASNLAGPLSGPERSFRTDPVQAPVSGGQFPGQGFLPDGRVWEMVSPPEKNGGGVRAGSPQTAVSPDGSRIGYQAPSAYADAHGTGNAGDVQYIAARGAGGWTSHAVTPDGAPGWNQLLAGATIGIFSKDVTRAVVAAYDLPQAADDMPEGVENLYRVNADGGGLQTLTTPFDPSLVFPLIEFGSPTLPISGDSNFDRVFFSSFQPLLEGIPPFQENVYEWHQDGADGHQRLTVKATGGDYTLTATTVRGEGTLTAASNVITGVKINSTAGSFHVGDSISGTGISPGTTITALGTGTLELSSPVSESGVQRLSATETTAPLSATAGAAEVQSALQALPAIGTGGAAVSGGPGDATGSVPYEIAFGGALAGNYVQALEVTSPALSGGSEEASVKSLEPGGHLRLAGVLPDGSIPPGGSREVIAESHATADVDTVSEDGSRVLFMAAPPALSEQLYMRRNHTDTAWISEPEGSTPVPDPQGVRWEAASRDLHRVLFSTESQLNDEDPGGGGRALYTYTDSPDPEAETNLKFIHRGSNDLTVLGASADGSAGYFFDGSSGAPLSVSHWDASGVEEVFDANGWIAENLHQPEAWARVSADGTTIAFLQLGNYAALYVYDSKTEKLACASCLPSGAATTGNTWLWPQASEDLGLIFQLVSPRFLSADGRRVFFSTPDALVPSDVNGRYDAYEYDVESGEPHLLSSGHSKYDSWFANASENGDDAFIVTRERLSGHDVDNAKDIYDARVGGGLPEPSPAPPACEGDACQPPAVSLNDPTPASESFAGQGNAKAKKKHKRRHGTKGHRTAKQKHAHKKQRANSNRRAGK